MYPAYCLNCTGGCPGNANTRSNSCSGGRFAAATCWDTTHLGRINTATTPSNNTNTERTSILRIPRKELMIILCCWIYNNLLQTRGVHTRERAREWKQARARECERERTTGGRGAGGWHIKGRVRGWAIPCNSTQSRLQGNAFSSLVFMKPFNMLFTKRFHSLCKGISVSEFFSYEFSLFCKVFWGKLAKQFSSFKGHKCLFPLRICHFLKIEFEKIR